jgi:hypothetical protein
MSSSYAYTKTTGETTENRILAFVLHACETVCFNEKLLKSKLLRRVFKPKRMG